MPTPKSAQRVDSGRLLPTVIGAFAKYFALTTARKLVGGENGKAAKKPIHTERLELRSADLSRTQSQRAAQARPEGVKGHAQAFLKKFGNDWAMNLCSMLAYNFLGAIFPLLLGVLALSALFLPASLVQGIGSSLNGAVPAAANGQNGLNIDFNAILATFHGSNASKVTTIISFAALLWTGTSLFGVMENCFSLIYRTKDRDFIWQKLMSIAMIVIFAVLTPLSFVASSISGSYKGLSEHFGNLPGIGLLFAAGGFGIGILFAFALFFLIYFIVPNIKLAWGSTWRGALIAAILFEAATLAFPIYAGHMGKSQFGSVAGLFAILTMWFWVISLILLIGAEVNSYFGLGQRAAGDDLPGVLHGMQVHGEMRRGEDASSPQQQQRMMEDVQPASEKERRH